jgi:uncharacterized linocin/CFP29 family protein
MNGTLGRDKVWNDQIWREIDKAVREEVGRIRAAQKVFPSTILNNVQAVPLNAVPDFRTLKTDDQFKPFIEMSKWFSLTQAQVESEETTHTARTLARLAARTIAAGEDRFLFLGEQSDLKEWGGIDVTNEISLPEGFIALANRNSQTVDDNTGILGALANATADLNRRNQPGPYALFLSPVRYAETFQPRANNTLVTTSDRIIPLVTAGFYAVNSLRDEIGILVSLGGEPTTIYLGIDATTAFAATDETGIYKFRVFERIQLVVRDPDAFEAINFPRPQEPPKKGK